jgi:hypothetical protein
MLIVMDVIDKAYEWDASLKFFAFLIFLSLPPCDTPCIIAADPYFHHWPSFLGTGTVCTYENANKIMPVFSHLYAFFPC